MSRLRAKHAIVVYRLDPIRTAPPEELGPGDRRASARDEHTPIRWVPYSTTQASSTYFSDLSAGNRCTRDRLGI